MGVGGISPVQLIIILVIVLLIFGTKKLRNMGGDLGGAIKGFKKAVKEEGSNDESSDQIEDAGDETEQPVTAEKEVVDKVEADEKKA